MKRKTRTIAGVSPADYAAMWGSTTAQGVLFYNYGSETQVKDRAFYTRFIAAIRNTIERLGAEPARYDPEDEPNLRRLLAHVETEARALTESEGAR